MKKIFNKYFNYNYNLILLVAFFLTLTFHKLAPFFLLLFTFVYFRNGSFLLKEIFRLSSPPSLIFIMFLLWSFVTIIWTTNPANGFNILIKLLLLLLTANYLFCSICKRNKTQFPYKYFFLLTIAFYFCYLAVGKLNITVEKRATYYLSSLLFPCICYLATFENKFRSIIIIIAYLAALYIAKHFDAKAVYYGILLGGAIFLLNLARPKLTFIVLLYGSFISIIITPIASYYLFNKIDFFLTHMSSSQTSLFYRFAIWNYVSNKIYEHPIIGWGLGASKKFPGGDNPIFVNTTVSREPYLSILHEYFGDNWINLVNLPLHPHNNTLQVFFELGAIGGIIYALFVASVIKLVHLKIHDKICLSSTNALIAFWLVICNMSHSVWHLWINAWVVFSFALTYMIYKQFYEENGADT